MVTEVSGPAGGVGPGASVDITTTVINTGKEPTGKFLVGFYLSTDETITTSDPFLGRFKPKMGPEERRTVRVTLRIPPTQEFGKYYLGAIADYTHAIPELKEENNSVTGNTILISPADLVMTKTASEPAQVQTDTLITITSTVNNKGTGATGFFKMGFYLSLDATIVPSADLFLGEQSVESLVAGGSSDVRLSVDIPNVATGPYTVGVVADYTHAVKEENEENNTQTGKPLDVTFAPATATSVAVGLVHSCATFTNGRVKCWGENSFGQLGQITPNTATPVTVNGITTARSLSSGLYHTCALIEGGSVKCWGYNGFGQLGDKTKTSNMTTPVTVSGITSATAIAGGFYHTCATLSQKTVQCWGHNDQSQLGNGTTQDSATPVTVIGITEAIAISSGFTHNCAVLSTGKVQCWGDNGKGQLGNGTTEDSNTPITVNDITTATLASLGDPHSCILQSDGKIKCWGYNGRGQLGNGTATSTTTPVTVSGINTAKVLDAGHNHVCAVLQDGITKCWGSGSKGQLGNGTSMASPLPVLVQGIPMATSVSTNDAHTCAVHTQGIVACWGFNGMGQLGDGTHQDSATPVTVLGLTAPVMPIDQPLPPPLTGNTP
jgi:alpha-tubulin suppressor-like RCC1 family protein